jgi:hypothetical protein
MNKLNQVRQKILNFINDTKDYGIIVILAAGLYPLIQYYSNNISEASSWQQLLFSIGICVVLPLFLLLIWNYTRKIKLFEALRPYGLSVLNCTLFCGLIGFLVFSLNKKTLLIVLVVAFIMGFIIVKHIKKIVVLQYILALISIFSLVPKLNFELKFDNASWAVISEEELNTTFVKTPNIFVIQPDGYVNFSEIDKLPYSFDNSKFENWLDVKGFTNYNNFRSNYYSTYTSNASMFAMQHHYYSNTNKATLKTHRANEAIVGDFNNVLKIIKKNKYRSHLLTDNSYFLIDREPLKYDYCNINSYQFSPFESGSINDVDLISDFSKVLDTVSYSKNFFFIEKTLPSHIMYSERYTKGKELERLNYLDKIESANQWLKALVNKINAYDENAIIIIVADHGGFVGLDYTLETVNRKQNNTEVLSAFSSVLSIKWQEELKPKAFPFKSNVNLFRSVFYALSGNEDLLKNIKDNSSFLPLKENGSANYYQYIDDKGNFVFNKILD